jgi:uncharacterized protein YkwD
MPTPRREFLLALLAPGLLASRGAAEVDRQSVERTAAIEKAVISLTNLERTSRRLRSLARSGELAEVARGHSRDMLTRGYFDHRTPEGLRPSDRLARKGLRFDATGENLYKASDDQIDATKLAASMVKGWMNSRHHRENILAPDFRFLGVGVAATSRIVLVTQLFAG